MSSFYHDLLFGRRLSRLKAGVLFARLLIAAAVFIASQPSRAQSWRADVYDIESGLPSNLVKNVYQDSEGVVWISADFGAVRYNGYNFTPISASLPSAFVKQIVESASGELFVVSDGGISQVTDPYGAQPGAKIWLPAAPRPEDGALVYPKRMYETRSGDVWIAERESVTRVHQGRMKRYPMPEEHRTESYDRSFFFFEDQWDRVWIVSQRGGTFLYDEDADELTLFEHQYSSPDLRINDFIVDDDGDVYTASNFGVYHVTVGPEPSFRVTPVTTLPDISCLAQDEHGGLYLGTWNKGAFYLKEPREDEAPIPIGAVTFKSINHITLTREGAIWIASNEGLAVLSPHRFDSIKQDFFNAYIASVAPLPGGGCLSTDGFSVVETIVNHDETSVTPRSSLNNQIVTSVYADENASYMGFQNGFILAATNGIERRIDLPDIANRVVFFMNGGPGGLWVCQDGLIGAFRVSPDDEVDYYGNDKGLPVRINVIRTSPDGSLYAAGGDRDEFLFLYDESADRFNSISKPVSVNPDFSVNDITFDGEGAVWLATSDGLIWFRNGEFRRVTDPASTTDSLMTAISSDENGLWIGAIRGLLRYAEGEFYRFSRRDGLSGVTITPRGLIRDSQGRLFIATSNGLSFTRELQFAMLRTPTPRQFEIRLDEKIRPASILNQSLPYHSFLEIVFGSLIFPSEDVVYQYRVNDEPWSSPSSAHTLRLPNLTEGQHHIAIRAQKSGYLWSQLDEIVIHAGAPWYKQPWALLLFFTGCVGLAAGAVAFATVSSKHKRSKMALIESEHRFQHLVQSTGGVILYISPDKRIREFNPAAEALFGLKRDGLVGAPLSHAFKSSDNYWRFHGEIERYLRGESDGAFESPIFDVEHQQRILLWNLNLLKNPLNEPLGVIALGQDITDMIRIQTELEYAKLSAEEASRAKSEFLANISHELRTPLNSVIGYSQLLIKKTAAQLNEREILFLQKISSNGIHLLSLINEILDLSKIEAGRMEVDRVPVEIDRLLRETTDSLEIQARAKGLYLHVETPKCGPIETDPAKLKQILINLIGNAIKFTSRGGVTVRLVRGDDDSAPRRIEVIDTGIGIAADKINVIFNAFQQAEGRISRKYGGAGLGLSISKRLCELLGFTLTVNSQLNHGSTFSIDL
ncbi:MAG: PAS domain S-box protein [bacterium]|nr:PAS domain S-box protein [bacterium]